MFVSPAQDAGGFDNITKGNQVVASYGKALSLCGLLLFL
jgi:hypothetical protein